MSRRTPRVALKLNVETLEARKLLSQGGAKAHPALVAALPRDSSLQQHMTPRPDLDVFASALVHHPRFASQKGLSGLSHELAKHGTLASRYGWGACLVMEIQTHPAYAARHHLKALAVPASSPVPVVPVVPTPPVGSSPSPTSPPPTASAGGGQQTLPLSVKVGGTLDVMIPTTNLKGTNFTYIITPQPLPANMTFNRGSGELVFAPAPGQEGSWNFTVNVSSGAGSTVVSVPITVTNPPRPTTEVSGQVVDDKGNPLADVPVMIGSDMTMTDKAGDFTLQSVPAQPGPLVVDGYHADAAGDYMMLMSPTTQFLGHPLYAKAENVVPRPIILPHIDLGNATDFGKVDRAKPLDLTSPLIPGVTLHVAPNSAMTMEGKPFAGKLAITLLNADQVREVLPPGIFPGSLFVGIDGPELIFKTPAQITLPNTAGYAAGHVLNLMSMNMTTGAFDVTGHLKVSDDKKWLIPLDGGLSGSSCVVAVPLQDGNGIPVTTCNCGSEPTGNEAAAGTNTSPLIGDKGLSSAPGSSGGTNPGGDGKALNSDAGLVSGEYLQDHALVSYQAQGQARSLDLQYNSLQADPRPVIQVEPAIQPFSLSDTIQTITAQLSVGGVSQGSAVTYTPSGLTGGAAVFRVPLQADATSLATGRYSYAMSVTNNYPSSVSLGASYTSGVNVVNTSASPLGAGWSVGGLQKVSASTSGAVVSFGGVGSDFFSLRAAGAINDLAVINGPYYQSGKIRVLNNDGNGDFTVPTSSYSGSATNAAVSGDFNADGKPDLAEATSSGIQILLGDGSGSFTTGSTYSLSSSAVAIVTGNFFGHTDGTLDLAVLRQDNVVSTFKSNGDGTFGSQTDTTLSGGALSGGLASSLTAGDFNGDGKADLAAAAAGDGVLRVMLGNGSGGFGTPTTYTITSGANRVVAAHFTGSSYLDLAVGNGSDERTTLLVGSGSGTFSNSAYSIPFGYGYYPSSFVAGDFYGTGRDDLATFVPDVGIVILTGQTSGSWGPYVAYPVLHTLYGSTAQLAVGDFNGDGKADLALTDDQNNVQFLLSNPDANQMEPVTEQTGTGGAGFAVSAPFTGRSLPVRYVAPMGETSTLTHNNDGTWTHAYSDTSSVHFNASGQESSQADRNGNTTTYAYVTSGAATGALRSVIDPVGLTTTLAYDTGGHLSTITDPANRVTTFTLDSSGNLTRIVDPDGAVTQYGYSTPSNHRITTEVNPNSHTATAHYDSFGRLSSETLFDGTSSVQVSPAQEQGLFAPGGSGGLPAPSTFQGSVTDANGHTTLLTIDTMGHVSVSTDANSQTTTIVRDMMTGWPTAVTDPLNRTTSYAYDMMGNVTKVTRPDNTSMSIVYDSTFNQPTSITDYLNLTTSFTLDSHGNVTRRTDPDLGHEDFTYNSAGQVLTDTDRNGHTTSFAYDSYGRLTTITYPGTGTPAAHFGYDSAGDVTAVTDELGHTTTFTYDQAGRVLTSQDPVQALSSQHTAFAYDADGNRTSMTDALGHVTSYSYDARDRLITVTDPVNQGTTHRTTYGYDAGGNVTSVIDPLGHATSYSYDNVNRLQTVTDALGHTTSYTYAAAGELIAVTDPNNHTTSYGYDVDGRVDSVTRPGPVTYTYSYDNDNNLTNVTDPLNNATTFTYDNLNRQTSETVTPDGSTLLTTSYGYDAVGNRTTVTDPLNHVTTYAYDARDRLTSETQPSGGGTTTYTYDDHSRLTSLTDPVGNTTSYGYDAANRVTTETDPRGKVTTYTYDLVGNLTQKTDRDNRVTSFAYDADNRETGETWVGASPSNTVTLTYDVAGRPTQIQDSKSKYAYTYDNANRLLTVDDNGTTGLPQVTLTYSYDNAGNRASLDDSKGGLTSYTYDSRDELTSLTQSGTGVTAKRADFVYDDAGRLSSLTRYSDLTGTTTVLATAYAYDQANRLTAITHETALSGGTVRASYSYTLDAASRLTEEARTWNSGTSSDTVDYTYTDNNQLTGVTHTNTSFANESFSYDNNGNRNSTGYSTGTGNRSSSDDTYNYAYDDEGNQTSRTNISTGTQTLYKWDFRNRLTEVDSVVSGTTTVLATFTYDALDRRIGVTESGATRWTLYDGNSAVLDFNGAGTQTARYLQAVDMLLARETSGGTVAWYLQDRLGSVGDIVDNAGALIDHIAYSAYGNPVSESSPSNGDRFKYARLEYDAATGLNLALYRVEDAATGRWLSEDRIGFGGRDPNLYRYVRNMPTDLVDRTGLMPNERDTITLQQLLDSIRQLEEENPTLDPLQILDMVAPRVGYKFVYTCKGNGVGGPGYIDTYHFFNSASWYQTLGYTGTYYVGGYGTELVQETLAPLGWVGLFTPQAASAWSPEDIPSDYLGTVFGQQLWDHRFDRDPHGGHHGSIGKPLSESVQDYFNNQLGGSCKPPGGVPKTEEEHEQNWKKGWWKWWTYGLLR